MDDESPIYVVAVDGDEAVALRSEPDAEGPVLARLEAGQLVARLDQDDRGAWWHVFADTPDAGAFVGYLSARFVRHWSAPSVREPS